MDRATFLTSGITKESFGIEIGPFYNPITPKSNGWKTTVVDFTDQEGLRDVARTHTVQIVRDMASNIEPVDVVWRGQPIDEACRSVRKEGFQYLIASHVIEHIPDIISFFRQVSNLANQNFILSLAVPDCRRTFDFFKPLSSSADALLAYREKRSLHSPETMFVARAYAVWVDRISAWLPGQSGELYLPDSLDQAHLQYIDYLAKHEAGTQAYVDSHCWYWTPSSFELMILELNHLGYIDFVVDTLELQPSYEFLVRMKKGKYELNAEDLQTKRLRLLMRARCELAEPAAMSLVQNHESGVDLQSKLDEMGMALAEARANLAAAQQRINDLESSTSWRITKPLRATKRMLR